LRPTALHEQTETVALLSHLVARDCGSTMVRDGVMKKIQFIGVPPRFFSGLIVPVLMVFGFVLPMRLLSGVADLFAQEAKAATRPAETTATTEADAKSAPAYSGMYSFLKDGEFVQVTVEEAGHVTGFISRFGEGESDKGAFLDQFFKSGKLEGSKLSFTTEVVHGIGFEFKGTVVRGEGKNPGDEGYFVLKGTLSENASDVNKKVTTHSQEVALKMFPQDAAPAAAARN
jgi:hypothetical protein